mgnify:CR=1 FL=1
MFTKAGLLIAVALVFLGFRIGKRKAREDSLRRAEVRVIPTQPQPKKEWLSVKLLLGIVIVLLLLALLSSLGGRVG